MSQARDIRYFAEIDSTNRWLRDAAGSGEARHGTVVIADLQTAGRGRLDRTWVAPPKSALLMSVLVDVPAIGLAMDRWPMVSFCMALAVEHCSNVLIGSSHGSSAGFSAGSFDGAHRVVLKWPNDVIASDELESGSFGYRKLAGILVEASSGRLIVGVGVNLIRPPEVDPTLGVSARPIWLSELTNTGIDRHVFANAVIERFFQNVDTLNESPDLLLQAYRAVLASIGWIVRIQSHGREWTAKAVDVDELGRLVVVDERGTHHLDVSEIVHIRPTQ